MNSLVCVGDNLADIYPQLSWVYPGGSAVNTAVQARRSGVAAAYLGRLSDDSYGRMILGALVQEHVDVSHTQVVEGETSWCLVDVIDGQPHYTPGSSQLHRELWLDEDDYAWIAGFDVLHTNWFSGLEAQLPRLHAATHCLSFDLGPRHDRPYLERVLPYAHVAFFSANPVGENPIELLHKAYQMGPRLIILTLQAQGVLLFDGHQVIVQRAAPVTVVDSLGAGDAFAGCFLAQRLNGASQPEALAQGVQAAARACSITGGFGGGMELMEPPPHAALAGHH